MSLPIGYKLYTPDSEKYYRYFKLQATGKLNPEIPITRAGERTAMMSIDRALELHDPGWKKNEKSSKDKMEGPKINFVTEAQQGVMQSEALLKREKRIKGVRRKKYDSQSLKRKQDTPQTSTKRKKRKKTANVTDNFSKK
jgi:hypothetical protein